MDLGGGGRGGGEGRTVPFSGIRPPAESNGPPFGTFKEVHFWSTDPKIFLKALLAPIYTNFEGECAPKKRDFPKSAQKRLFWFFQKFAWGAEYLAKAASF